MDLTTQNIATAVTNVIEVSETPVDQVASAIGVAKRTLDHRLEGRREFTATALVGIALATDSEMDDLLPSAAVP